MTDQVAAGAGEPSKAKARGWRLAAFALPGAPLLALSVPPIVFLPPYYIGYLGLDEALVGFLFLAARAVDIFLNPTIGGLQDRTRVAIGRRRAWLIGATPLVMAAVWLAFIGLPANAGSLFAGLAIFSLYATFASAMIAHLSWAGELEPDYNARTKVLGAVQIASSLGQVIVMAMPAIVQQFFGGTFADGVHVMGWTIIIALPVCVAIAVLSVPEPVPTQKEEKRGFKAAMAALQDNQPLRRILVPDFLLGATQGVAGTLFILYGAQVANLENPAAFLLLYFAAGLVGAPLWTWLGRKYGKHKALQWACLWWGLALAAIPLAPTGNAMIAALAMAIAGIPAVAGTMLLRAMMADVSDEDELKTGQMRSGLFFGLLLTTGKIGLAMGPASLIVLAAFGYKGDVGAQNTPLALMALTAMFAFVPMVLNGLAAWSLHAYPLDQARQRALREAIEAREAARARS
ncbi:MAG: MFS transporter [Caulobacterales bacterium]